MSLLGKNSIFLAVVQALAIDLPARPEAPLSPSKSTKKLSQSATVTTVRRRDATFRKTVPTFGSITKSIAQYLNSTRSTNSTTRLTLKSPPLEADSSSRQNETIESTVQRFLQERELDAALLLASGEQSEFSSQVQTEVLRIILTNVECAHRLSEQRTLPSFDNLCDYIAESNDRGALALLKKGARLDYSIGKCRGVLLELFSSKVMPLTINFLIENELLPCDLGIDYFMRSVNSPNVRLTSFLASGRFPEISRSLLDGSATAALQHFQMLYAFQTTRHIVQNMNDYDCVQQLANLLNMNLLSPPEYVALIRSGSRFNCFADRHLLDMRRSIKDNLRPYAGYECLKELYQLFAGEEVLKKDQLLIFHSLLSQRPEYAEIAPTLTLSIVKHSPRTFVVQQRHYTQDALRRRLVDENNDDDDNSTMNDY